MNTDVTCGLTAFRPRCSQGAPQVPRHPAGCTGYTAGTLTRDLLWCSELRRQESCPSSRCNAAASTDSAGKHPAKSYLCEVQQRLYRQLRMEGRTGSADPIDMTSAAQTIDTGASEQRALTADVSSQLPHHCETRDGVGYCIRPIVPDDAGRHRRFIKGLSDSSRVTGLSHEPSAGVLNRLVRVDYRREMALGAVVGEGVGQIIIGVARYGGNPAFCELAIAVADDWQSRGVGSALAQLLLAHAKTHGVRRLYCRTPANNTPMLKLANQLQMTLRRSSEDQNVVEVWRTL
jgi:GNAT superfamily N-acetyltransferase